MGPDFLCNFLCLMMFYIMCSYARIQPSTWSGAFQCWGRDNREAPLRTASPPGCDADIVSNFELKSFDGCANPHLGLAAIITAGMDGLRQHLQLPNPVGMSFFKSILSLFRIAKLSLVWFLTCVLDLFLRKVDLTKLYKKVTFQSP